VIQLVVNADDLGMDPAIDEGIFRARGEGILTSATVLVCGRSAGPALARATSERLPVGVHLCLSTAFAPAAPAHEVPTVAPGGRFRASWAAFVRDWALGRVRLEEVDRELRAQLARARALGAAPDHLDGHQHLHVLPGVRQVVASLARDEGLPVRWPWEPPRGRWARRPAAAAKAGLLSVLARARPPEGVRTARGIGVFETGLLQPHSLCALLESLPDGTYDLCAHPGLNPAELPEDPAWRFGREAELAALCDDRVRAVIDRRGIRLTSYATLAS
jgi:predicted glycoside hydrolase/deacetylase ChbG (UPF0249 family)